MHKSDYSRRVLSDDVIARPRDRAGHLPTGAASAFGRVRREGRDESLLL